MIGLLIGILVQYFNVQPFIATLAAMFLARGLAFVVSLKSIRSTTPAVLWLAVDPLPGRRLVHHPDRHRRPGGRIGAWVLQYTRFGRTVYAIGGNEQSAADGPQGGPHQGARVRDLGASPGWPAWSHRLLGRRLPAQRSRHRSSTRSPRSSSVARCSRRPRLRARLHDRRLVYGTIKTIISFLGAEQSWTQIIIGGLLLVFIGYSVGSARARVVVGGGAGPPGRWSFSYGGGGGSERGGSVQGFEHQSQVSLPKWRGGSRRRPDRGDLLDDQSQVVEIEVGTEIARGLRALDQLFVQCLGPGGVCGELLGRSERPGELQGQRCGIRPTMFRRRSRTIPTGPSRRLRRLRLPG